MFALSNKVIAPVSDSRMYPRVPTHVCLGVEKLPNPGVYYNIRVVLVYCQPDTEELRFEQIGRLTISTSPSVDRTFR